eukprot:scaffold117777_cov63-Phaeocystis_antarctica.AAC.2
MRQTDSVHANLLHEHQVAIEKCRPHFAVSESRGAPSPGAPRYGGIRAPSCWRVVNGPQHKRSVRAIGEPQVSSHGMQSLLCRDAAGDDEQHQHVA